MENDELLPTGWHWKITPEQIEKIKANDRETINQVYFDNYDTFSNIAQKTCSVFRQGWAFGDMLNQIYLDLPNYNYSTLKTLFGGIRKSVFGAMCLHDTRILSLDVLIGESDNALITLIPAPEYDPDKETEYEKSAKRVLNGIARQTAISERWRDRLTAIALDKPFYAGLFHDEYEYYFTR